MFKKKSRKSGKISTVHIDWTKKYIDQEPQYLMRQICVLQWEEIKTTHYFWGKRAQGRGGIRMLLYFPYWPESQKSYEFALTWFINLFFCWTDQTVQTLQLLWGRWVCLHFSHRVQYTIWVYLSWAFLYIVSRLIQHSDSCFCSLLQILSQG